MSGLERIEAMQAIGLGSVASALPSPIILIGPDGTIVDANPAAEAFFDMSLSFLQRSGIDRLCGPHSALPGLVRQVREGGSSVNAYRVDLSSPRQRAERLADIYAGPLPEEPGRTIVMINERTIADKFSRQLSHRGAVRSVSALAAMLAHEIKNPLSGIRGAAQLLDPSVPDDDRVLTQLIRDETDRIVKLVERFEMFTDGRAPPMEPENIHVILDHVRNLARSGFARHIRILVDYDPSLPPVLCNKDQMIQVLLNLVKNAAEAIGPAAMDGEIQLRTAYRPGVRIAVPGSGERVRLPLEVCVCDNGPGVPEDIRLNIFDPFVSTKSTGNGLGLALAAKVIGDHGGIVECESQPRQTVFRLLLPMQTARDGHAEADGE